MPHATPWRVTKKDHPGSTWDEILSEPDWGTGHEHRVGFINSQDRKVGISGADEYLAPEDKDEYEEYQKLKERVKKGDLLNFRDLVKNQPDFHLRRPENRSLGWRYVLEATEDGVKDDEKWPANVQKRKKEEEAKVKENEREDPSEAREDGQKDNDQEEHDWRKGEGGESKHHDAYATNDDKADDSKQQQKSEDEKLRDRYTPQEIALLRALQHEQSYVEHLGENPGTLKSPQTRNRTQLSIDEADQFTPDNWLPRSSDLIRLTGKHPLNAEAHLSHLFDAGLITPNELHYVRNHGSVPRILWEFHRVDVQNGKLVLTMDDVKNKFDAINIPIALACDGNRRKELNMIKRSKGFNWGPAAVSCCYWKGALLRDVLHAAGVPDSLPAHSEHRYWVNFEGADDPSEGKYQTCIPLQYAMAITNDVILAYEMNDLPLPPDHGYPLRLMIPGFVGGRCVKWLHKIWVTDYENDSYYHIWDNRVLPSFVTEKDGPFAETLFNHPDTACNEQNLNSVIVHPAQGEKIPLASAAKQSTYRISGYAYDGGGHEVQRVEVSLDDGDTWLYCIRQFPDAPVRHGNRFWTWLHWHVDVSMVHVLQAKSITVRAFNVFKNTQPREPVWNIMGMMNNCWYVVKTSIVQDEGDKEPTLLFRHPVVPGTGEGGWMKPSTENQIAAANQEAGAPQKQFTREEIEKHGSEKDCWIVVQGKVYDATSVLSWHPGGKAAILGHAGRCHQQTTDEFESVHDGFAWEKLKECILGTVTDKAMNYIKKSAEQAAKEKAKSQEGEDQMVLQKHRWVPVKLLDRRSVSEDTRSYTFGLPDSKNILGLGTCQHIQVGFHMRDKMLIRSYTPTAPLLPAPREKDGRPNGETCDENEHQNDDEDKVTDGQGTFQLTVKTYFPTDEQPGGAMSNILDCVPIGEEVEIRGPTGEIVYNGNGKFVIEGKQRTFKRISLVLGGSGITPGYALIARIVLSGDDNETQIRVVDANKSEQDILLKDELDGFERKSEGKVKIVHVLSHSGDGWKGLKGHVNADILKENLFEPNEDSVVFLCGPPAMVQKAALPALREWGYKEDENMFGF